MHAPDSISAMARLRPLLERETLECGHDLALAVEDDGQTVSLRNSSKSGGRFSRCFKMREALDDVSQEAVFRAVQPMLEGALEGYNTSVLAYGQTGTGKTRTMLGYDMWDMANTLKADAVAEHRKAQHGENAHLPGTPGTGGTSKTKVSPSKASAFAGTGTPLAGGAGSRGFSPCSAGEQQRSRGRSGSPDRGAASPATGLSSTSPLLRSLLSTSSRSPSPAKGLLAAGSGADGSSSLRSSDGLSARCGSPASPSLAEFRETHASSSGSGSSDGQPREHFEQTGFPDDAADAGLIPRSMEWLLKERAALAEQGTCQLSFTVRYVEIYNEAIRDLLAPAELSAGSSGHGNLKSVTGDTLNQTEQTSNQHSSKGKDPTWLTLHPENVTVNSYTSTGPQMAFGKGGPRTEKVLRGPGLSVNSTQQGQVTLLGAEEVVVSSMEEVLELLWTGAKARSICATDMNSYSSRSHTVFQVSIEKSIAQSKSLQVTKLSFVDLAGSEKINKYTEQGQAMTEQQLKELKAINKSLGTLTAVVNALVEKSRREKKEADAGGGLHDESKKGGISNVNPQDQEAGPATAKTHATSDKVHIPYRDSKLTRFLQDCIGNGARTLFVCTLSPSQMAAEESAATLGFADRCLQIQLSSKKTDMRRLGSSFPLDMHMLGDAGTGKLVAEHEKKVAKLKMCISFLADRNKLSPSPPADSDATPPTPTITPLDEVVKLLQRDTAKDTLLLHNEMDKLRAELATERQKAQRREEEFTELYEVVYKKKGPTTGPTANGDGDKDYDTGSSDFALAREGAAEGRKIEKSWKESFFHMERKQCDNLADSVAALGRSQVARWEWLHGYLSSLREENNATNMEMENGGAGDLHNLTGFDLEQRVSLLEGLVEAQSSRERRALSIVIEKLEENIVARHGRNSIASSVHGAMGEHELPHAQRHL